MESVPPLICSQFGWNYQTPYFVSLNCLSTYFQKKVLKVHISQVHQVTDSWLGKFKVSSVPVSCAGRGGGVLAYKPDYYHQAGRCTRITRSRNADMLAMFDNDNGQNGEDYSHTSCFMNSSNPKQAFKQGVEISSTKPLITNQHWISSISYMSAGMTLNGIIISILPRSQITFLSSWHQLLTDPISPSISGLIIMGWFGYSGKDFSFFKVK